MALAVCCGSGCGLWLCVVAVCCVLWLWQWWLLLWMEVFQPDSQTHSSHYLRWSSVMLYYRGSLRDRARCGAECPSDCRGNACGCGRRDGDDITPMFKTTEFECSISLRIVHECMQALGLFTQLRQRGKCVPCKGLCFHHPLRTMDTKRKSQWVAPYVLLLSSCVLVLMPL